MAAEAIGISRWQETVGQLLPRELKNVVSGSPQRELLKQVGATILVFDDQLVELESGRLSESLDPAHLSAESLARAASEILDIELEDSPVVLLLPPHEFVATSVEIPGMNRDMLISALKLQADSLLPSHTEQLAVVASPHAAEDAHGDVALWIPERRLDELYQAFDEQGLSLTAVLPRCLALLDAAGEQEILDEDRSHMTRVLVRDGAVVQWLHISRKDLEQDIFERQWRQELAVAGAENPLELSRENAPNLFRQASAYQPANTDYYFFPRGALQARRQQQKGKRLLTGVVAAAVVIFFGCLPFLFQTFENYRLQAKLSNQRELSSAAREDRQVVQNFEQQWGVIIDFPRQDVVQTLFTLQSVLSPEQLTSLELSEGVIRIEGESAEPQAILQRLETHPMFTEVTFSRATSNSRYYIDLRLSTVNFEGYLVRYFPEN